MCRFNRKCGMTKLFLGLNVPQNMKGRHMDKIGHILKFRLHGDRLEATSCRHLEHILILMANNIQVQHLLLLPERKN